MNSPMDKSPFQVGRSNGSCHCARTVMKMALLLLVMLLSFGANLCFAAGPSEYQVKAAFIFNFIKFTEWQAHAFSSPESPIVILVVGQDPVADELETLKGKLAQGRKLVVKRSTAIPEGERVHVLFVCKNEGAAALVRPLRNRSVLTISDGKNFCQSGGMIGLVTADNKVTFAVNTEAMDRSGLKLSSQVLKMAKIVRDSSQKEGR